MPATRFPGVALRTTPFLSSASPTGTRGQPGTASAPDSSLGRTARASPSPRPTCTSLSNSHPIGRRLRRRRGRHSARGVVWRGAGSMPMARFQ